MRKPVFRSLIVAAAVLAGTAGYAAPSHAMVANAKADFTHVAVGSFWASTRGGQPFFICTGTLVSSTVFVTAGHCVDYVVRYGLESYVSFKQKMPTTPLKSDLIAADAILNPRYKESNGTDLYQFDVSVLVLRKPFSLPHKEDYGQVAPVGLLDGMKSAGTLTNSEFTLSGYGTEAMVVDPLSGQGSPISFPDSGERRYGTVGFAALATSVLHENQRANAGYTGAGYGDSGGPTFLPGSNTIVGVTSTGDIPCYSTNTAYRLDTQEAHDFLDPILLAHR